MHKHFYFVFNWKGLPGLKYPSVKSDYVGHNIVLTPATVEQFLELEIAAMFRIIKKGDKSLISPISHATDFGPLNSSFKWVDVDNNEIEIKDIK